MAEPVQASAFEQVTRERVDAVAKDVHSVKETLDNIWKTIGSIRDDLANRLPPWVTWVISVQMALIGGMAVWILERLGK